MNEITYYLSQITPAYWGFILVAGIAVSATLELTKHVFSNALKDKKKTLTALLSLLSIVATVAEYIISNQSNLSFLGIYTPAVVGIAVVVRNFAVSPIANGLRSWAAQRNQQKADLANYRALLSTTDQTVVPGADQNFGS